MKTKILAVVVLALAGAIFASGLSAQEENTKVRAFAFSDGKKAGWLGVSIQDITPKLQKKKELKSDEGAYVNDVIDDGPADSAGVKEGDVIVEFNSKKIDDADDLMRAVQKAKPGTKTTVIVLRNNEKKSLPIAVGKMKRMRTPRAFSVAPQAMKHIQIFAGSGRWGLRISELNPQLGEYFGAPNGKGLLVEEVQKKSSGEKAGFKAGDVITKVNKNAVEEMGDIGDAIEDVEEGEKVDVEVLRKGTTKSLSVEVGDKDDEPSSFNFRIEHPEDGTLPPDFQFDAFRPQQMREFQMQLKHSLPDLRGLHKQMDELKERMSTITL